MSTLTVDSILVSSRSYYYKEKNAVDLPYKEMLNVENLNFSKCGQTTCEGGKSNSLCGRLRNEGNEMKTVIS